jgi:hypothetical protein
VPEPIVVVAATALVSAAPAAVALRGRFGARIAVALVGAGGIVLLLSALAAGRLLGVPVLASASAAGVVMLSAGVALLVALGPGRRPRRADALLWSAAGAGGIVWLAILAVRALAGSPARAWSMSGDTINNIVAAQLMVEKGGVATVSEVSTVPLPQALLVPALALIDGDGSSQLAARIDVVAGIWALLLAAVSLLVGVAVASGMREGRLRAVVGAAASLLPLAGWIAGIQFGWGFLNAVLSLAVLVASWVVAGEAGRHPAAAFCAQLLCATVALATWTPMTVVPGVLLLVQAVSAAPALRRSRLGWPALVVLLFAAQFLIWTAILLIPSLLLVGGTFGVAGVGVPSPWAVTAVVTVVAIGASAALLRRDRATAARALVATAGLLAAVVLVTALADSGDRWSAYYPSKIAWLAGAFLLVVVMAVAARGIDLSRRARPAAGLLLAGALVLAVVAPGGAPLEVLRRQGPAQALGSVWNDGDRTVDRIVALVPGDRQTVLWRTDDPDEAIIDFWLLAYRADSADAASRTELRRVAYAGWEQFRVGTEVARPVALLCTAIEASPAPVTVITADAGLESQVRSACDAPGLEVRRG